MNGDTNVIPSAGAPAPPVCVFVTGDMGRIEKARRKIERAASAFSRELDRDKGAQRGFLAHAAQPRRAAKAISALSDRMGVRAHAAVMAEFERAARNGDDADLHRLAEVFADEGRDDAWELAALAARLFDAATSQSGHGPALLIARLRARLHQLLDDSATIVPDEASAPFAPLDDVHVLAAPAPANAPPHRDLPTLREVAA